MSYPKKARAWLKEAWIRLKACKELIYADSYMVFTRSGKQIFICYEMELNDPVIDAALDESCRAMVKRADLEEFLTGVESVANEAKDILRRASGEA